MECAPPPVPAIEIEFAGNAYVRITASVPPPAGRN